MTSTSPSASPSASIGITNLLITLPHGLGLSAFSLPAQPCTILLSLTCHLKPACLRPSDTNGQGGLRDDWDALGIGKSVNYSALAKTLGAVLGDPDADAEIASLAGIARRAAEVAARAGDNAHSLERIDVTVVRPKAVLFADSVSVARRFRVRVRVVPPEQGAAAAAADAELEEESHALVIRDIRVDAVIGLHPHEREEQQRLVVDVELDMRGVPRALVEDRLGFDYKAFGKLAYEYLCKSSFKTIEALGYHAAHELLQRIPAQPFPPRGQPHSTATYLENDTVNLTLRIKKPSAIALADHPVFTITRCLADYRTDAAAAEEEPVSTLIPPLTGPTSRAAHAHAHDRASGPTAPPDLRLLGLGKTVVTAYIAIGTNLGDRIQNIHDALAALPRIAEESLGPAGAGEGQRMLKVVRCSQLYESAPMYVLDQPEFINGAIQVETNLRPVSLLRHLKAVETTLGRVKTMINGPRLIDLDLLVYGNSQITIGQRGDEEGSLGKGCGWLQVPHWGIGEREFVLRPLRDMMGEDFVLPGQERSIGHILAELEDPERPPALHRIIPFASPARPVHLKSGAPLIMGILNVTPDSFSDGDEQRVSEASLEHVLDLARALIAAGADILDIGGMSTRPGVKDTDVTMEEEMARVVPVIQALRIEGINVPISIDTFRAQVAEQAILAGASCINDVRGGREPGMLQVMAKLNVPVILMHSRGDSREMLTSAAHDYTTYGGTVAGVRTEMKETVARAEAAGVRTWNIILDPGIGFAKSQEGNLQLLRALPTLFGRGTGLDSYAVLVGASRKGFIGKVLEQPVAKEREFGNAAVTALCCQSEKVDIVRVHEPRPARDVIRMLEAIRES